MSVEIAKKHLEKYQLDTEVVELNASTATVELAAQAIGCAPARIAKTLSFKAGDAALLIVTAGDARIDNKKFKATFGFKAKMLKPDEVIDFTGHAIGGVCPFGIPSDIAIYLDKSLERFDSVYPACGSANSMIHLTLDQLALTSEARGWVDVCKVLV